MRKKREEGESEWERCSFSLLLYQTAPQTSAEGDAARKKFCWVIGKVCFPVLVLSVTSSATWEFDVLGSRVYGSATAGMM